MPLPPTSSAAAPPPALLLAVSYSMHYHCSIMMTTSRTIMARYVGRSLVCMSTCEQTIMSAGRQNCGHYLADHRRRSEGMPPTNGFTQADAPQPGNSKSDGGGFDMFNEAFDEAPAATMDELVDEAALMDRGDNYDDKEGYFAHRIGDILHDRYKVRHLSRSRCRVLPPSACTRPTHCACACR